MIVKICLNHVVALSQTTKTAAVRKIHFDKKLFKLTPNLIYVDTFLLVSISRGNIFLRVHLNGDALKALIPLAFDFLPQKNDVCFPPRGKNKRQTLYYVLLRGCLCAVMFFIMYDRKRVVSAVEQLGSAMFSILPFLKGITFFIWSLFTEIFSQLFMSGSEV